MLPRRVYERVLLDMGTNLLYHFCVCATKNSAGNCSPALTFYQGHSTMPWVGVLQMVEHGGPMKSHVKIRRHRPYRR